MNEFHVLSIFFNWASGFMESLMAGTPVVVCPGFADPIANAMRADAR